MEVLVEPRGLEPLSRERASQPGDSGLIRAPTWAGPITGIDEVPLPYEDQDGCRPASVTAVDLLAMSPTVNPGASPSVGLAVRMAVQPTASPPLAQYLPSAFWRFESGEVHGRIPDAAPYGHPEGLAEGNHAGLELRQIRILNNPRQGRVRGAIPVPDDLQAVIEVPAGHTHHRRPAVRVDPGDVEVEPVPVHLIRPPLATARRVPAGREVLLWADMARERVAARAPSAHRLLARGWHSHLLLGSWHRQYQDECAGPAWQPRAMPSEQLEHAGTRYTVLFTYAVPDDAWYVELSEAVPAPAAWADIPNTETHLPGPAFLTAVVPAGWPKEHGTFHALRHSFATTPDHESRRTAGGPTDAPAQDVADHAGDLRPLVAEAGPASRDRRERPMVGALDPRSVHQAERWTAGKEGKWWSPGDLNP